MVLFLANSRTVADSHCQRTAALSLTDHSATKALTAHRCQATVALSLAYSHTVTGALALQL